MPLVWGAAVSHSPLMYRPLESWPVITRWLRGDVPQPAAAGQESPEHFAQSAVVMDASFHALGETLRRARLDALVVMTADRQRSFDDSNFPQFHVHAGDSIWGDTSLEEIGEAATVARAACDVAIADLLIEELFDAGFDVAESHGPFDPTGSPQKGAVAALFDPLRRLDCAVPIIPVHVNCHLAPMPGGGRTHAFGAAIGAALRHTEKRVGVLASGGMSGDDRGGSMAGWIDPTLDQWALRRLETSRTALLTPLFDGQSTALRGHAAELRLWLAAGGAMETVSAAGKSMAYLPLHAAAAGIGFFRWETPPCR